MSYLSLLTQTYGCNFICLFQTSNCNLKSPKMSLANTLNKHIIGDNNAIILSKLSFSTYQISAEEKHHSFRKFEIPWTKQYGNVNRIHVTIRIEYVFKYHMKHDTVAHKNKLKHAVPHGRIVPMFGLPACVWPNIFIFGLPLVCCGISGASRSKMLTLTYLLCIHIWTHWILSKHGEKW